MSSLPVFRAAGSKSAGTTGETSVSAPSGLATGDLEILIAECATANTISISTAGGGSWTLLSGLPVTVAAGEKLYVWWRIRQAGDSDPGVTPSADHVCACRLAYQAGTFDTVTPIDAIVTGTETTSDTSYSFAPGNNTSIPNCLVLSVSTILRDSNVASVPACTNASLTSLNSRANYNTNSGNGGGFGVTEGARATVGSVGTWACTYAASSPKSYVSFAIRPAQMTGSSSVALTLSISSTGSRLPNTYYGRSQVDLSLGIASKGLKGVRFDVAASADDGVVSAENATYPPSAGSGVSTDSGTIVVERSYRGGLYVISNGLIAIDTAALSGTPSEAVIHLYLSGITNADSRQLQIEYYDWSSGGIDTGDWTATAAATAHAGTALSSLQNGWNTLTLQNLSSISTTGKTYLRLHISGGSPSGTNAVTVAMSESGIEAQIKLDSPSVYWRMNADARLAEEIASLTLSDTGSPSSVWDGDEGALNVDTSGEYVSRADDAAFRLGLSAFTIACWAKWVTTPTNPFPSLLRKGSPSVVADGGYVLYVNKSTRGLCFKKENIDGASSSVIPSLGEWAYLAYTWSSADQIGRFYINGVAAGTRATSTFAATNSTSAISIADGDSSAYPVYMDEVAIWSGTQVSEARLLSHYNAWQTPAAPPRIYAYEVSGPPTVYGSSSVNLSLTIASVGKVGAKGRSQVDLSLSVASKGYRTSYGRSAVPITLSIASLGRRGQFGTASVPISLTISSLGRRGQFGRSAVPLTLSIASVGKVGARGRSQVDLSLSIASLGRVGAKGRSAVNLTLTIASIGTRKTFGSAAVPLTLTIVSSGTASTPATTVYGSAAIALSITVSSKGTRTVFGTSAVPLSLSIASVGKKTTFGSAAVPLSLTVASKGYRTAYGRSAVPLSLSIASVGRRTAYGRAAVPITLTIASSGIRKAYGVSAVALSLTVSSAGRKTTFGRAAVPLTITISSNGTVAGKVYGSARVDLTLTISSAGTRKTFGSAAVPLSLGISSAGRVGVFGRSAVSLSLGISSAGARTTFGRSAVPLSLSIASVGRRTTYGTSSVPLTLGIASKGYRTAFGRAAVPLTLSVSSMGRLTVYGKSAVALTLSIFSQSVTGIRGSSSLALSLSISSKGTRIVPATVSQTFALGISAKGYRTTFGRSAVPITLGIDSVGRVWCFGAASVPLLLSISSKGTHLPFMIPATAGGAALREYLVFSCTLDDFLPYSADVEDLAPFMAELTDEMRSA